MTDCRKPAGDGPPAVRVDATGVYLAGQWIAAPFHSVGIVGYRLRWQPDAQQWVVIRPGELRVQSWSLVARLRWGLQMAAWWRRRRGPRPDRAQAWLFNNIFYGG